MKVAILDDYQNVALRIADWSRIRRHHGEITVFNDHVADPAAVVERLRPFDVVCVTRERMSLTREILQQLSGYTHEEFPELFHARATIVTELVGSVCCRWMVAMAGRAVAGLLHADCQLRRQLILDAATGSGTVRHGQRVH
jgi:hypothetical protein